MLLLYLIKSKLTLNRLELLTFPDKKKTNKILVTADVCSKGRLEVYQKED